MVCCETVLCALAPLWIDGTTVSMMAINVVHCSGVKVSPAGRSGKGDTRGVKMGWVEPMMLMMEVDTESGGWRGFGNSKG